VSSTTHLCCKTDFWILILHVFDAINRHFSGFYFDLLTSSSELVGPPAADFYSAIGRRHLVYLAYKSIQGSINIYSAGLVSTFLHDLALGIGCRAARAKS